MTDSDGGEETLEAAALRLKHDPAAPRGPEKLDTIFREHHEQVFRAAYRITGSASDAEDVLQTVFLRLLRLERGDALSENPGSYLRRAAVNASLDLVRSRRTWKTTPIDEAAPLADERGEGPERSREGQEVRQRIRECLAGFSPKMAEIFTLRYFEGYENREIARALRTSRSTVAVLLHRARIKLKKEMRSFRGDSR